MTQPSDPNLAATTALDLPGRAKQLTWIALLAPSLLLALSAFIPLTRTLTSNDIDWPVLLDELHGRDIAFGTDIVFTFGPWGFVWGAASPKTFPIACLVWTLLAIIVWWVLARIVGEVFSKSPLLRGIILVLLVLPLGGDYVVTPDVRLLLLSFLLLLYHFVATARTNDATKLMLIAAVGFVGLIKFTCFVTGTVVIGVVVVDELLRRRNPLVPLLTWLGAILLGWLLAGQSLLDLPAWLGHSMSMTAGYADVMSLGSAHESRQVLAFFLPALLLMLLLARMAARSLGRRAGLLLSGMFALLLITFRCGYVRHDLHELTATILLLEIVAIGFMVAAASFRNRREAIPWGMCLIIAGLSASQSLADWHASSLPREISRNFRSVREEMIELTRLARGQGSMVFRQRQEQLDAFRNRSPLPPLQGTADLYPRLSVALLANGIPYNPRATLQSHAATTPALTALNASHLRGPNPPDHLFIDTNPSSEHLPMLLDNRSWPEILSRYHLEAITGSHLHLTRRSSLRIPRIEEISQTTILLGERMDLPADPLPSGTLLWAQVEVRRNAFGWMVANLYKPPRLSIHIVTADGRSHRWRFVPALAADGFILGPLVVDAPTMTALFSGNPTSVPEMVPRSIAIGIANDPQGHWQYHQEILIRLHHLRFETAPP